MKNIERMKQGLVYISDDEIFETQKRARRLTQQLNTIDRSDFDGIKAIVKELFGKSENAFVNPPFYCDYGDRIEVGKDFFANYNCTIIDLYDRSVVASVNDRWITSDLAISAVDKALRCTNCNPEELILHSDQGTQFTSLEFILHCEELGITQSMSHAGCPYDNAPMERYYNTLKEELIYQYNFEKPEDLDYAISEFAYNWYNQIRPHSYNGYRTPFEKRYEFV